MDSINGQEMNTSARGDLRLENRAAKVGQMPDSGRAAALTKRDFAKKLRSANRQPLYFCAMLAELLSELQPHGTALVAVSKTQPIARLRALYDQGQRAFGENRAQEMLEKRDALPADVEWHLIGHLQTNKVKGIVPFVRMIHSVDSLRLLQEIDKQAQKCARVVDCLLQFHIAREETKFGLDLPEALHLLGSPAFATFQNVRICGVMGMASFSDDEVLVRGEFRHLKSIFEKLKADIFPESAHFREISMGMSGDWRIAVEEGSTMVRIGSLLFGARN
jgi:PLP dependent protein